MSNDINVTDGTVLETLNNKIDIDGGNYKGSGLANYVVDKSGDTMTGDLEINRQSANPAIWFKRGDIATGDIPASVTRFMQLNGADKNGKTLSIMQSYIDAEGKSTLNFAVRTGENAWGNIVFAQDSQGKNLFSFPRCTTKATTTSSASSANVAVVVQNYVNGTSWYRVWSDGWKEQGGEYTVPSSATTATVTFLKSFSNTNYSLMRTNVSDNNSSTSMRAEGFSSKSATGFTLYTSTTTYMDKIMWYACGY